MKVYNQNLYYHHKKIENQILNGFVKSIRNSSFIGGAEVKKFEDNFKKINQSRYCISCANGSDALVIALKTLGIKKGDEVITTALSWIATSAAVTMAGGKVIFCDIEKDGFNISPQQLEAKITKRTVGIIPVHLYGIPADMKKIIKIAKKNKLWIIEDCAQSHLAEIQGKKVGNFGSFGTFSFFPGKNLGALGDAGCLVTKNKNFAEKARLIANHGGKGKHIFEGMNSRMDAIQAKFLNIKIQKLKSNNAKRIRNSKIYINELKTSKVVLPKLSASNMNTFHQFVIRLKNRNLLKKFLLKNRVESQIHYKDILPLMKAYKRYNFNKNHFPNAYKASKEILSLPISPEINKKQIKYISQLIKLFLNKIN
jgi:dTDP-4-amino-4,6-dideoxygalactose transaminase